MESIEALRESSRISVIIYTSKSKICFKEEEPNENLIHSIKYKGGGTNFDNPLFDAHTLCK